MFRQDQIAEVVESQKNTFLTKKDEVDREAIHSVQVIPSFATIITGIRRCGKSTLVSQMVKNKFPDAFFVNFEDIRLAGFETDDFMRLYSEIVKQGSKVICFDEIQLVKNWEMFVHQLLREEFQVFVTGSNASLLSRELGTHLTGRYLSTELFPFSYNEFLSYKKIDRNAESVREYMNVGGMPEYVKTGEGQILNHLIDDILIRDISVRQSLRDVNTLRQLTVYLLSNVGNLISASKLIGMFGMKSATTFLEYFSFLSDAYLVEFIPQFSYSLKKQARNLKKVYALDLGFVSQVGMLFTENNGQRFENLIYLHLRKTSNEIFYYKDKGECDFVTMKNGQAAELVQACYEINDLNFEREYSGLVEALKFFKKEEGIIVTINQSDKFEKDGYTVRVVPAHEYLC
jgi:predicted AAA+ superfamily ATPase